MEGKWAPQIGKENKYGYNGKELDEDFGLNWHHYGFRMYDAAIGRFPSADPAAEQFSWVSPYNYAENSPIANVDLWGLQQLPFNLREKAEGLFNYFFPNVNVQKSDPVPPGRKVSGKEVAEGIKNVGDKVSKTGLAVATVNPAAGGTIATVGKVIEVAGHTSLVGVELLNEGLTEETVTDIAIDGVFEILPKPVEAALEKAGLDKQAKNIIEGQVNVVNEVVKEVVKNEVDKTRQNSNQNQTNTENCDESCEEQ